MTLVSDYKTSFHFDLRSISDSFKASRIFLSAVELQIFEILCNQALTAKAIAARIGTNEHATQILLNALTALGFLEKRRNQYVDIPLIAEMLRKESSKSTMAWFRHQNNSWRRWSELTQIVKKGCAEKRPFSRAMSIDLAMSMQLGAKNVAERLDLMMDLSGIKRICDMGCGAGAIVMELLQMHHQITAALIDHDQNALDIARQEAAARGLQNRIEFFNENIFTYNIKQVFDIVILSMVLCLFNRQKVLRILKNAKAILRPGGTLILGEMLLKESRTRPLSSALFAVHLLVNGADGDSFSLADIRQLLCECGIQYERNFPTNLQHIIIGKNESDS